MISYLDFEKPIASLEAQIAELRTAAIGNHLDIAGEIERLEAKAQRLLATTYGSLNAWQKTQVARHPARPRFRATAASFDAFVPLAGDRAIGDDQAILGGFARIGATRFMVIGTEKGDDTQSRVRHNFGMGKPEGYRKAIRLMRLAERFGLPVVTLVDTSGAFPGVQAEERGQAEAIARATETCLSIGVPLVACILGEGGSGGAVALASGDRVLMMEHAVYAVISPEGCASILWRSSERAADAADAMKVTADDLLRLGVIDRILPEPLGGAQRDPAGAIASIREAIATELAQFEGVDPAALRRRREERYLAITELAGA